MFQSSTSPGEADSALPAAPLPTEPNDDSRHPKPFWKHIYFWVLLGVVLGVGFGLLFPSRNGEAGLAEQMKPLGEGFISLVKMLIAPIVFLTVVSGIASVGDLKKVGRVGIKAFHRQIPRRTRLNPRATRFAREKELILRSGCQSAVSVEKPFVR